MASRFQRDASRNALFSNYDAQTRARPASDTSKNKARYSPTPYGYSPSSSPYSANSGQTDSLTSTASSGPNFGAYPPSNGDYNRTQESGFRAATPNKKGQYSDAVIDELESQNDSQVSEMSKKVRMLKDITLAIGDEIRDSTAFAEKMNDGFEGTRNRLRGTMNRMLRMAERTGIGWRVWLIFFAAVFLLFVYVWLA